MKTTRAKQALAIIAILFTHCTVFLTEALAQAPPPSSNPPGAPIDGLTSVLLIAGIGYGIRRMRGSKP